MTDACPWVGLEEDHCRRSETTNSQDPANIDDGDDVEILQVVSPHLPKEFVIFLGDGELHGIISRSLV